MIPKEAGLSHGPAHLQSPQIEGNELTVLQIKADLKKRCQEMPLSAWDKLTSLHNSKDIEIGMKLESPLIPQDKSHEFRWDEESKKYVPLAIRHVMGNDIVGVFITREGKLLEKLVHYSSDGPDSEKWPPDEELGETSGESYQEFNNRAIFVLDHLMTIASDLKTTSPEQSQ